MKGTALRRRKDGRADPTASEESIEKRNMNRKEKERARERERETER